MNIFFIVIGVIVCALALFVAYRLLKVKAQRKKLDEVKHRRLQPLYDKLMGDKALSLDDVLPFAENMLTRYDVFHLLKEHNKLAIFPIAYYTLVKGAESSLATWLEFPTELDACPDEMEHIKRVTFDFDAEGNQVHYEVFKYRVNAPHWAADNGWMLGVVGPFFDDSEPYDFAHATFSRVDSTVANVSPEDEAKWVHEHISLKR
ncbi:hypothetical protein [Mucilaginibacter flavus]|uniref:hypothetical protein n=1 Tax=Mucilaginibacter flavus TaxID=931504 RepID=UPI0025B59907|nr:hypothetical protein [Mucilaginibacter flavus]MDN3581423.1 hypothetical protein [Mucilaginibacter flavus]